MAKKFKIDNSPFLTEDLQKAVDFYKRASGSHKLGKKLISKTKDKVLSLETNALHYEIKYRNIRCVKVKGFPYRIHFEVNEKENSVYINGLFSTSESPDTWEKK